MCPLHPGENSHLSVLTLGHWEMGGSAAKGSFDGFGRGWGRYCHKESRDWEIMRWSKEIKATELGCASAGCSRCAWWECKGNWENWKWKLTEWGMGRDLEKTGHEHAWQCEHQSCYEEERIVGRWYRRSGELTVEFGTPNVMLMSSGYGERNGKGTGVGLGLCSVREGTGQSHGCVWRQNLVHSSIESMPV